MKTAIYLLLVVLFSSCNKLFMTAYGIKNQQSIDVNRVIDLSKGFSELSIYQYYVDTQFNTLVNKYNNGLIMSNFSSCSSNNTVAHNLKQPIQILVFGKNHQLYKHYTNCNAGGFPNLKWNNLDLAINNVSDTFDSLNLASILNYAKPLQPSSAKLNDSYDKIIVVFWNHFMYRQSKNLLKYLNKQKSDQELYILINNDNYFPQ